MKRIFFWLLEKNPSGTACLITGLLIGVLCSLAGAVGLLEVDPIMALKIGVVSGVVMFFLMPIANRFDRHR